MTVLLSATAKDHAGIIAIAARINRRRWRIVSICPEKKEAIGELVWYVFYEAPGDTSIREIAEVVSGESPRVEHAKAGRKTAELTQGPYRVGKNGSVVICDTDPTGGASRGYGDIDAIQYYGGAMIAESIWKLADAHLLAASWDMLKACEEVLEQFGPPQGWEGNNRRVLLMIENAITKAKQGDNQ